jgi:ADP-ribose pyrophosphatase YjhB (NUDIX family)
MAMMMPCRTAVPEGAGRYTGRMLIPRRFKHCPSCGTPVSYQVPPDDNRERATCPACASIHYENPINVVGTLPIWGEHVLLCRRNIEPRWGKWTLPAGFLELGESSAEGALRETDEEAGAQIELQGLYCLLNVVRVGQIHFYYRARLLSDRFNPGPETIEARLFHEHEVPWEELAFHTVKETLRRFFEDRREGRPYALHCADIG